jgi:hypothetical protein
LINIFLTVFLFFALLGDNLVLGEMQKVSNKVDEAIAEQKKLRKDLAEMEIRRLRKELDCWHSNARTRIENELFKSSLVQYYGRSDPSNNNNIICMLTNQSFVKKHVRGSHILKKCTDGDLMQYFGLEPNIDHPRNGLLLLEPIELAFDRKDLCFLYNPTTQQLSARLLNNSLTNEIMKAEDGTSFNRTFSSIDGLILQLPNGVYPYRRILSLHAKFSFSRALNRGWIPSTEQFEAYFSLSDAGLQEPLGIGSLTWQEVHSSIHLQLPSFLEDDDDN